MKRLLAVLTVLALPLFAELSGKPLAEIPQEKGTIFCGEEDFPGHLQGIAADESGIYWSFYDTILKTDWTGKTLKKIASPTHAGDCCLVNGQLYVSICYYNKKQAEEEGGTGWCYIYDKDLQFVKKVHFSDTPRPDGITWLNGKLYVANDDFGVNPHPFNFVQIYDGDFKLQSTVKVDFGMPTQYGAQTLNALNGTILAAFYGDKGRSPFMREGTLEYLGTRFPFSPNVGLAAVPQAVCGAEDVYVMALNLEKKVDGRRRFSAKLLVRQYKDGKLTVFEMKK